MSGDALRDRLRGSLQTRVYLLLAFSAVIPVGLIAWAFLVRVSQLDEQLVAARQWSARTAAGQVEEEMYQGFEVLQRAATAGHVNLADGDPGPEQLALRDPRVHLQYPGGAFFLDASGQVIVEEPDRGSRSIAPIPDLPAIRAVLVSGRPVVTPFVQSVSGEHVYALVPVRDWEGRVTGIAGGVVDASQHHLLTALRYLRQTAGGSAEIVDRSGRVVATTDAGRPGTTTACSGVQKVIAEGKAISRMCRDCHSGTIEDERGRAVVTTAGVANAPWVILARVPASEVPGGSSAFPAWLAGIILTALGEIGRASCRERV